LAHDELGSGGGANRPDGHPDGFISTPSLGDIDGDGDMEIVIGGMDRRIHALHHDGTYVLGWPLDWNNYRFYRESRSTASLADMDGDGVLDIIIGSNNYVKPACPNPYIFYAIKSNTLPIPGFPISTTQNIESSPAMGDINNDGALDIVFGTGDFNENCGQKSDGKKVYAIDNLGQPLPGWPVRTDANMVNSPALGDLDNDGTPEVVIHTQDTLYAWHGDGSLVDGFPVKGEYNLRHSSPVLADVDGDSEVEIILASGQVYGPNGELEQQRNKLQSQVVVTDQDDDGLLETVGANHFNYHIGLHLTVYIFHETGDANGALPWPMFHRSPDRAGVLPILYTLSGRIIDEFKQGVANVEVTLSSGQSTLTDGDGNYFFGSLPPGKYTVTPSYQNNVFKPAERVLTLDSNTELTDMVMYPPVYDIRGRVMHANGSPMAGVEVQLNESDIAITGADGIFSFDNRDPDDYTLTPISPEYSYLPEQRSLSAEEEVFQTFYALPQPVVDTLLPNSATQISFEDTQGLPTQITFPQGLGEEQATITPIWANAPSGYRSTGHAINIVLSNSDADAQSGIIGENGEPLILEVQIQYNEADLQSLLDAEELVLLWQSPDGWVDAQEPCAAYTTPEHDLASRIITVPVCQWGTYGLFAPLNTLLIPSIYGRE
jgi:hypothetical protein